jgi:predicted CXXCH cytochrome family protein
MMTADHEERRPSPGKVNDPDPLRNWVLTGLAATLVIVLSLPLYLARQKFIGAQEAGGPTTSFVGREKCKECHREAYDKWLNSHHDLAMDVAGEETVLGDFNNALFEHEGVTSLFYRDGDRYMVRTEGPGGRMGDFEITHTFGWTPLQQYLVPFPGGRLQCLSIGWDVEKGKWYRLPPLDITGPDDWLHWTGGGQTWNAMCAECHSTNLRKGYDLEENSYDTTWSEIDVSCEACHGPGSLHVKWAELPAMARPPSENYDLVVRTSGLTSREYLVLCARCHSRRQLLGTFDHSRGDLLDSIVPTLLGEGLYFPDGQILEEVYVYGSFFQSKMYRNGVNCSDCHDSHSARRLKEGNDLCLQCHRAEEYNTRDHHFHKEFHEGKPSEGWLCEKCHMPGRYYMGIDYRPDHSIRNPRPDLSVELGLPNSCNMGGCHDDKTDQWSADYMVKWYGEKKKPHYGRILAAGREGKPEALDGIIRLAEDRLVPVIVRATALSLLANYPGERSERVLEMALADDESLIRHNAVRFYNPQDRRKRVKLVGPLLYDEVRAVRAEAAMNLTVVPMDDLREDQKKVFTEALREYRETQEYMGDFPGPRMNLGNMYANLGRLDTAEENYNKALEIDHLYHPARNNLAMLYNRLGRNDEAESLLRELLDSNPGLHEIEYSLALLLAEEKRYGEAVEYLERAAAGLPGRARIRYNLGLLYQELGRMPEAERAIIEARGIDPENFDFLYALADHYLKRQKFQEAGTVAREMMEKHPGSDLGEEILKFINSKSDPAVELNQPLDRDTALE